MLDALADEGFPRLQIPEDIDRKFDDQFQKLRESQPKYSLGVQNGMVFFQCDKS